MTRIILLLSLPLPFEDRMPRERRFCHFLPTFARLRAGHSRCAQQNDLTSGVFPPSSESEQTRDTATRGSAESFFLFFFSLPQLEKHRVVFICHSGIKRSSTTRSRVFRQRNLLFKKKVAALSDRQVHVDFSGNFSSRDL